MWLRIPEAANQATLLLSNGTTRDILSTSTYPTFVGSSRVFDAGWNTGLMTCAVNGVESSQVKTVNCTTSKTCQFGGSNYFGWYSSGNFYPLIVMSVLPTASERATLRQFIASLSGVAL